MGGNCSGSHSTKNHPSFTTTTTHTNTGTPPRDFQSRISSPIPIPTPRRDPDEIPTPVSGRGHRRRHHFPFGSLAFRRDLSPIQVPGLFDENDVAVPLSPIRHMSISTAMHGDRGTSYYTPTSPLSPNMNPSARPISPQPSRPRASFSPKSSKPMRIGNLPRFHPAVYQSPNQTPDTGSGPRSATSPLLKPGNAQNRLSADSPRLMRQYQRELLARADISSRMAASPYAAKPNAPRIDPADSPGPVTPLELENAGDYFMVAGGGNGPAISPGSRGEDALKDAGSKAKLPKTNTKKSSPRR